MLQNQTVARKRTRIPVPIIPTLVIGVGKYGREVGVQLAARLLLTEDGLRETGLSKSLLVQTDDKGDATPGFIRIMELDWDQWFASGFKPEMLLTDIDISGPSVAEEGTPPRQREDDRHPDDWIEAKSALPKMAEQLFDVSLPLRIHDTPIQLGNFLPQGQNQNLTMRVYVVCASREADSAVLVPELIRLLGKAYVTRTGLAKGIQILCYVGGTSRTEHMKANGDDQDYDLLLETEVTRVLPKCLRAPVPAGTPQIDSLLDHLEQMWLHDTPQTMEACYLIDTQLANLVASIQNRPDEPDEAVIASALALNMFIASNADATIRHALSHRWNLANPASEPGVFATFGVASYSLDHPKLRRLVYNYVTGMFLLRAQPVTCGDRPAQRAASAGYKEEELLDNPQLETQLNYKIQKLLDEYEKSISSKTIERKLPNGDISVDKKLDYKKAIILLSQVDTTDRAKIKEVLERITDQLADDMGENALKLRAQKRQFLYMDELSEASFKRQDELLVGEQAPLIQLYRFVLKSLETLREEARKASAPITGPNLVTARRRFAIEKSTQYNDEFMRRVDNIKREMRRQPTAIGALGRALLIAPILAVLLLALSPLWNAVTTLFETWFSWINFGSSFLTSVYNTLYALPAWVGAATLAAPLWMAIFYGHRRAYHERIKHQLKLLAKKYEAILKETNREAWRWALGQTVLDNEELEKRVKTLSRPGGIVSGLRDTLLAEQFIAQDRILERIFFDDQLQADLKKVSRQLTELGRLWDQRRRILNELIHRQALDQDKIGKWLREDAEQLYRNDSHLITDLVSGFLKHQTVQRLEEMLQDLSSAAIPFLQRRVRNQDDPAIQINMFGVHGIHELDGLDAIAMHSEIEVLDSADRLRWIFLRVQSGLHLDGIKFSIESLIP